MARPARLTNSTTEVHDDEQSAWLRACEAYQKRKKLKFLNKCDYLAIAKELGYVKAAGSPEGG